MTKLPAFSASTSQSHSCLPRWFVGVAGCVMLALSACSSLPSPADTPTQASAVVRPIAKQFELAGRMSATGGEHSASGRVEWAHDETQDAWTVFSPTGQIVAQLQNSSEGAILRTADGQTFSSAAIDDMLPQLFGVQVPLEGLVHWVQAGARAGARILSYDAMGRPARISDAGWIIDYASYAADTPSAPPRRIDARWGQTHIRLVIDQWTAQP